jgi:hypothetical protein
VLVVGETRGERGPRVVIGRRGSDLVVIHG